MPKRPRGIQPNTTELGGIISENVRRYQRQNGVKGEEIARRLGIMPSTFYSKLSRNSYSLDTLYEMALALRVEPYRLLMKSTDGAGQSGRSLPCFSPPDYPRLPRLLESIPVSQTRQVIDQDWLEASRLDRYALLEIDASSLEPRLRPGDRVLVRRTGPEELFRPGLYGAWAAGKMWWGRARARPEAELVLTEDNPKTGGEIRLPAEGVGLLFFLERTISAKLD